MSTQLSPARNVQLSRWVFTYHNYDESVDYKNFLSSNSSFRVKRAVWGHETTSASGVRHLQGYVEYNHSVRISHCRKIFPTAYWSTARSSAFCNFKYCTKSGNYHTIGDFSAEERGHESLANMKISPSMILRGLLRDELIPQIKVSKEYADRYAYFDRTAAYIRELKQEHHRFNQWKNKKLYLWQELLLEKVMNQTERSVFWVTDSIGNKGKTYLCKYLSILYSYQFFDGLLSGRDAVPMVKEGIRGFCFDVSRANLPRFDYGLLENLKSGMCISGKYRGRIMTFDPLPVVVFSNGSPKIEMLSADRWQILDLGEGELAGMVDQIATVSPSLQFPFVEPAPLPDLSDNFLLKNFLADKLSSETFTTSDEYHTSQIAGPSTVLNCPIRVPMGTATVADSVEDGPLPIIEVLPPLCALHPDQSVFRKGCPCLVKKKRTTRAAVSSAVEVISSGQAPRDSPSRKIGRKKILKIFR